MEKTEAKKIISILKTADGGCKFCVQELEKTFAKQFPEYKYLLKK